MSAPTKPGVHVRLVEDHPPVKAARAQQGWVQNIGPVSCRDDDHIRVGIKAVHLDQNLVQGLFPLVVTAAQPRTTVTAYSVYFVHKNDARAMAFGLIKEITDPRRPHTDEHFHKLGTRDGEERHARFSADRFGHQRFPRARSTHQEHTLGDTRSQ